MNYRHGDVVLSSISEIPEDAKELTHLELMQGEVTGHAHRVTKGKAKLYQMEDVKWLWVQSENAELTHEEHATITLPPGKYKVRIQREYTPEGWDYVKD